MGTGDCHASLEMTRIEGLAMTGKIVSGFMQVALDNDDNFGRCSL